MKYYRLKALSVSGLGNKIFYKGDNLTYPSTAWREGRAEQLVKENFLEEVVNEPTVESPIKNEPDMVEKPLAENLASAFEVDESAAKNPDFDSISSKEINRQLKEKDIAFNQTDSKKVRYDLLFGK